MTTETRKEWLPMEIDAATLAFPASVSHLMPAYKEIPQEFYRSRSKWNALVTDWFFCGLEELKLKPKPGIDEQKALRHISAIMRSFEPKHEHKEAACAYLMSLWFEDATWKRAQKAVDA